MPLWLLASSCTSSLPKSRCPSRPAAPWITRSLTCLSRQQLVLGHVVLSPSLLLSCKLAYCTLDLSLTCSSFPFPDSSVLYEVDAGCRSLAVSLSGARKGSCPRSWWCWTGWAWCTSSRWVESPPKHKIVNVLLIFESARRTCCILTCRSACCRRLRRGGVSWKGG